MVRPRPVTMFVRRSDAADHGHLRATVDGRAADLLCWGDLAVHPHAIRSILVRSPHVADYQIRQTDEGVAVAVTTLGAIDTGELAGQLTEALRRSGLGGATATVTAVPTLPRHPETGKLASFVPRSAVT